jgi:4-hydroxy-3-polyprenylbenzoate decarboxylase
MHRNLTEFIRTLEAEGELLRVKAFADPVLEIAEITDRMSNSAGGGKALLFENTGTGFPVLTNMFGSEHRMALALGVERIDEIAERIDDLLHKALSPKDTMQDKMRMLPLLGEMSRWLPKKSGGRGSCRSVVMQGDEARLSALPILKCWPCDGGRFVTLPLVNTVDPDTGARNVGMYRMQVTGERTTGMHWHIHKTGERHYRAYKRRGERMPVSVCIGGDPIYTYAATAPMPDNMDEYLLAGFLRRKPVKLVKCITNDIWVPEDCDFVIEGYVDPAQDKFTEGPFGDHTGFYSLEDPYPEFHITAITHRKDAVYPATIVGVPPQEDAYIAMATERIFLAPIRLALQPEIRDMYMPAVGVAHNLAIVAIDTIYGGQALKVASALWGAGQMMFNKVMLVTSADTDIRDARTIARLLRCADMTRDVTLGRGVLDILDHATATPGEGGKLAIDLTSERAEREVKIPARITLSEWATGADMSLAEQWGAIVVTAAQGAMPDAEEFLSINNIEGINYLVVTDDAAAELTHAELLWLALGNIDPARDIRISGGVMIIDARAKTPPQAGYPYRWPNVVTASAETISLVDRRWSEYGIGDLLPSPSLRYARLNPNDKAQR